MPSLGARAARCPSCKAPFSLVAGQTLYTCGYCGASIDLNGAPAQAPLRPTQASASGSASAAMPVMVITALVCIVLGVGVSVFLLLDSGSPPPRAAPPRVVTQPRPPPAPLPAENIHWNASDGPVVMDLNGDGTDDIIGHVSAISLQAGGTSRELVAAFDGKTFAKLWEVAPEGPASDAQMRTWVAKQAGRLVMTEPGAVRILEPATGRNLGRVPLSDKPSYLCVPVGNLHSVWVEVEDGQHLEFDVQSGTSRPALKPPPSCAARPLSEQTCSMFRPRALPTRCEEPRRVPAIAGFTPRMLYRVGDLRLVIGVRSPGTSVPMAAVFEERGTKPLWHGLVADMDPLRLAEDVSEAVEVTPDAVYLGYGLKEGGMRLTRRDIRTGAVVWDVPIPGSKDGSPPSALWLLGGRMYVPHWTWLDVFDIQTGQLLGRIGKWM
ncbi:PQQ-binding-like beta-propeller repeat protein [Corallococcus sp. M34]|uniref:outer membrane protein assembly factor BamB family protein n=1 Tax=Citreicoccus inhibens TaxID=2849499 RepID=UPI001C24A170|nr:PQQ-binding-like beta-propeller repeat protein [Citreicoccus inhibens]MBU8898083.1 PQQ-binding-like beta-propeller repeat protein [Citreicoccus inhibens]